MNTTYKGYVVTDSGDVLVQLPADNTHGFTLCSDVQSWPGGQGVAQFWTPIPADAPRITPAIRERLQWILDSAN